MREREFEEISKRRMGEVLVIKLLRKTIVVKEVLSI